MSEERDVGVGAMVTNDHLSELPIAISYVDGSSDTSLSFRLTVDEALALRDDLGGAVAKLGPRPSADIPEPPVGMPF